MKNFLLLLVCLSLSLFTAARGTKPAHTLAPDTKTDQEESTGQEAVAKPFLKDTKPYEEVASDDDDSAEDASGDEEEDVNDDDDGGAVGDEGTGVDDGGDDDGDDDGSGDEGE